MTGERAERAREMAALYSGPSTQLQSGCDVMTIGEAVAFALAFADAEAAAMRERAAGCAMSSYDQWLAFRDKGGVTFGAERYDDHECDVAARTSLGIASAIRALPATGEVGRG